MKKKRVLLFLVFIFLAGCSSCNQEEYLSYPAQKIIFPNGFRFVTKTVPDSRLVSIDVLVKIGSAREEEFSGSGISHFTEHMLFKSNKIYLPGEIHKLAGQWGGFINGFTGTDYTHYRITVLKQYFNEALVMLHNMMFNPDFKEQLLNEEKKVILNEINLNEDKPQYKSMRLVFRTAFEGHPYSLPVIGYESKVKAITAEQIKKFYEKYYVSSNMIVSVAGDFSVEDSLNAVKDFFLDEKGKIYNTILYKKHEVPQQVSARLRVAFYPTALAYVNVFFPGIDIRDEDLYAMDVLAYILGGGESSRLNKTINIKDKLVNLIGAYNYTPFDDGIFNVYAITDSERLKKSIKAVLLQFEKIKKSGVNKKELTKVINGIKSRRLFDMQTVQSQAENLTSGEFFTGNYNFDIEYLKKLEKVTCKDIQKAAEKYLDLNKLNIVLVLPEEKKYFLIKDLFGEDFYNSDDLTVSIDSFDVNEFLSDSKNKEISKIKEEYFSEYLLDNGMSVLIKEEKGLGVVSVRCVYLAGVLAENEKNNGISKLTSKMLLGGTSDYSKSQILDKIELLGGDFSIDSGYNSLSVGMDILKENFDEGLKLLFNLIKESNFPVEEFNYEKFKQKQEILYEKDDIFQVGLKNMRLSLFGKHPYKFHSTGTLESIDNITRQDAVDFYKKISSPKSMVFTVAGDINKEDVFKTVNKYLGHWKKDEKKFCARKITQLKPEGIIQNKVFVPKQQKLLLYGFRGIDIKNPDKYALDVLTGILSGGGSRLWQEIREKRGCAYSVGAYFVPGIDPGYYAVYVLTDSKDMKIIKKLVQDQINFVKQGKIKNEEIKTAKKDIIGSHISSLQSVHNLVYTVSLDNLYGLGYDNYLKYQEEILKVGKDDIIRVAQKYLDFNNCVIIEVYPENEK